MSNWISSKWFLHKWPMYSRLRLFNREHLLFSDFDTTWEALTCFSKIYNNELFSFLECPTGSVQNGFCTNGQCIQGYVCSTGNICCSVTSTQRESADQIYVLAKFQNILLLFSRMSNWNCSKRFLHKWSVSPGLYLLHWQYLLLFHFNAT